FLSVSRPGARAGNGDSDWLADCRRPTAEGSGRAMTGQRHRLTDLQRLDLPHKDHAHVWYCQLNISADLFDRLHSCLTAEELEQTSRLASDTVRNRFVVGRGVLRTLLSCYLDKPPSEI